jgi:hypothetical protein
MFISFLFLFSFLYLCYFTNLFHEQFTFKPLDKPLKYNIDFVNTHLIPAWVVGSVTGDDAFHDDSDSRR